MKPGDRKRFGVCLVACAELYGKPPSDPVMDLWWNALQHYDIEAVESAFARHVKNPEQGRFMPKPADILAMIEGTTLDVALVAWSKVDGAVRGVGGYQTVVFDDPLIHRVIADMGGWTHLCAKTEDEWPFLANEFRNRYHGFRSRREAPPYPPKLIGIFEGDNTRRGHAYDRVVFIGDEAAARAVLAGGVDRPALPVAVGQLAAPLLVAVPDTRH